MLHSVTALKIHCLLMAGLFQHALGRVLLPLGTAKHFALPPHVGKKGKCNMRCIAELHLLLYSILLVEALSAITAHCTVGIHVCSIRVACLTSSVLNLRTGCPRASWPAGLKSVCGPGLQGAPRTTPEPVYSWIGCVLVLWQDMLLCRM